MHDQTAKSKTGDTPSREAKRERRGSVVDALTSLQQRAGNDTTTIAVVEALPVGGIAVQRVEDPPLPTPPPEPGQGGVASPPGDNPAGAPPPPSDNPSGAPPPPSEQPAPPPLPGFDDPAEPHDLAHGGPREMRDVVRDPEQGGARPGGLDGSRPDPGGAPPPRADANVARPAAPAAAKEPWTKGAEEWREKGQSLKNWTKMAKFGAQSGGEGIVRGGGASFEKVKESTEPMTAGMTLIADVGGLTQYGLGTAIRGQTFADNIKTAAGKGSKRTGAKQKLARDKAGRAGAEGLGDLAAFGGYVTGTVGDVAEMGGAVGAKGGFGDLAGERATLERLAGETRTRQQRPGELQRELERGGRSCANYRPSGHGWTSGT